ncbi:MAG TPA: hypothetical protein VF058_01450 [Actinomycetota bacterium]
MSDEYAPLPPVHPVLAAMAGGALWGAMGYAILWGLSPIVVQRRFVVSAIGTIAFLPVRLVLWTLRWIESIEGRPFEFAHSSWWIGALAAVVGAGIGIALALTARTAIRRLRPTRD